MMHPDKQMEKAFEYVKELAKRLGKQQKSNSSSMPLAFLNKIRL